MSRFYRFFNCCWRGGLLALLTIAGRGPAQAQSPAQTTRADSLRRALMAAAPRDTSRGRVLHELALHVADYDLAQALTYARQELAESQRASWTVGQAQAEDDLGRLYWRQGNYPLTQQHILAAITNWQRLRQPRRAVRSGLFIVEVLAIAKQYDKAAEWQNHLLGEARAAGDTFSVAQLYMEKGRLELKRQDYASAARSNELALRTAQTKQTYQDPRELEQFTLLESVIRNNLADVYVKQGQPERALPYSLRAIAQAGQFSATRHNVPVYEITLAEVYQRLGQVDEALAHALTARQLIASSKFLRFKIAITDLLDTLYAQQGNYRLARRYGAESRALEARQREQEQATKVAELQGRYDTQAQERSIRLLTQQNQIAQLAALQQRTLRNAALLSAGLLLLAVGVLYNRYRLRQRTVRLLDAQNQEKEALLREKTLLLQEVHHRVKNNLQIVLSLLSSQLETLRDPAATAALRESQGRVQTMALIHERLYQSESLARLDMRPFLTDLLAAIAQAYQRVAVAVVLDVAPTYLSTQAAVPLGLIVNELATNAFKYAFRGARTDNELRVALRQTGPARYELVVADNGPGLPPLDPATVQSLGLRLTAGLVRQVHGQLGIEHEGGTRFTISFSEAAGQPAFTTSKPEAAEVIA